MNDKNTRHSPLSDSYPEGTPTMTFGGWEMPRDFGGIIEEHNAVRERAGIFDLSHMGRIVLKDERVASKFQAIFTRTVEEVEEGRALYGFLCDESGGCIDDIIAYVRSESELWLVVNAGNRETVLDWLADQLQDVRIDDRTTNSVLLALQGPEAPEWYERLGLPACPEKPFRSTWEADSMIASTGYTGEAGGEAWLPVDRGRDVFREAIEAGLTPCGLGARDTLRLEMGYPLHGHELSPDIDPVTANLEFFIDWDHDFVGRDTLTDKKKDGTDREIRGIRLETRRSPVEGAELRFDNNVVGEMTSGRYSPTLETGIGMCLIDSSVDPGETIETNIRDDWFDAKQVTPPFIRKETS